MATAQMDTVIRHLRRAVLRQDGAGWTDGQLLASFIDQKDEAAFEALVRRHGPMVFGVCRRVVGNHHDAEDAFQATFLVLARKASSVRPRERVANWLHGVALRTAMKAKAMTAKRRGREKQVTEMPEPEAAQQDQWRDLQPLLDQELNGLPENYRLPILLCDLEGKTIKEATQQLGWPQGTLAGRLARGRKLLAKRLASRGVVLSAGSLAAVVSQNVASAAVPTSLMSSTVKAAAHDCGGAGDGRRGGPGQGRRSHGRSAESMLLTKVSKAAVAGLLVLCLVRGLARARPAAGTAKTRTMATNRPRHLPLKQDAESVAEAGAKPDPAKTDLDRLQGVWSAFSVNVAASPSRRTTPRSWWMGRGRAGRPKTPKRKGACIWTPPPSPGPTIWRRARRRLRASIRLKATPWTLLRRREPSRKGRSASSRKGKPASPPRVQTNPGAGSLPLRLPDGTKVRAFPAIIERETPPLPRLIAPQPKADTLNADKLRSTTVVTPNCSPQPKADTLNADKRVAKVGSIIVVGNTKTEQSVILKKIPLAPGDVLDYRACARPRRIWRP